MPRILVIEDEAMLRSRVVRGLAKLSDDVVDAGTLDGGLRLIDEAAPDAIVSDIDLPGRSGLELLGELGRRGVQPPVLFVSGYLNAYRSSIPRHANVEVLEKPVSIEQLRSTVGRLLDIGEQAAPPAPFSVTDYVQLACMGQHSIVITTMGKGGPGSIVVVAGDLWAARDDTGGGEPALRRLLFSTDPATSVTALAREPGDRNIEGRWEWVLMEAARLRDEGSSDDDAASGEAPVPPSAPAPVEEDPFEVAVDAGVDALLGKRYEEALGAFLEARTLRPGDSKVEANIARLTELGVVAPSEDVT